MLRPADCGIIQGVESLLVFERIKIMSTPLSPKQIRVLVIETSGAMTLRSIGPDLATFQKLVGGDLEAVYGQGWALFCDENGKVFGREANATATLLAHSLGWGVGDVLVGSVVFLGVGSGGREGDVPQAVIEAARRLGEVAAE